MGSSESCDSRTASLLRSNLGRMSTAAQIRKCLEENPDRKYASIANELGTSYNYVKKIGREYKHKFLFEQCEQNGLDFSSVKHYWYKGKSISAFTKNEVATYDDIREDVIREMKEHAPSYPTIKRTQPKEPHLLVVDPADIHIGKIADSFETGEDYNNQIAVKRVREGIQGILDKTSSFNIDRILFVGGNDILHIDTPKRTTTSGTPQDTDGMWYSNFILAKKLHVEILETLMSVADVHYTFNPSNHDYMNGFFLADTLSSWFANCKHISFDTGMAHRKYFRYSNNVIGTTHGDGAKEADLPLLMAQETGEDWLVKHRYIYKHHLHHKTAKDYGSVNVETMRSASGTDSWHHRNGFQYAPKAIEGFIHHPEHGQIARITHIF